jgi:hypothetical protein
MVTTIVLSRWVEPRQDRNGAWLGVSFWTWPSVLSSLLVWFRPQIECYDWDKDGSHDFIGAADTSLRQLIDCPRLQVRLLSFLIGSLLFVPKALTDYAVYVRQLINPKKKYKKKKLNSGEIEIMRSELEPLTCIIPHLVEVHTNTCYA